MKNNIIFLDIDGVLNSSHFYHVSTYYTWDSLDPKAVKLLNELVERHKAKIIIISDWRKTYGLKVIKSVFKKNKVNVKIISTIDNNKSKELGIIEKVKTMSETLRNVNFIVLDDEPLLGLPNFVKTNPEFGFTYPDFKLANKLLNKKQ